MTDDPKPDCTYEATKDGQLKRVMVCTTTTESTYDPKALQAQYDDIQAQRDRDNAARDAELAEVKELMSKCKEYGIE